MKRNTSPSLNKFFSLMLIKVGFICLAEIQIKLELKKNVKKPEKPVRS